MDMTDLVKRLRIKAGMIELGELIAWGSDSALMREAADVLEGVGAAPQPNAPTFQLGDHVRKTKGSQWKGRVVGTYSTSLTPEGYAVESDTEKGSVQIYPVGALELVGERPPC